MNSATWIYDTLKGDSTISGKVGDRVYRDSAPEGTEFPFIAYQLIDSVPVSNAFKDTLMNAERWQIKAVDKGNDYGNIDTLVAQIITLFHKGKSSGVISSTFEFYLTSSEIDNGVTFKTGTLEFRLNTQ